MKVVVTGSSGHLGEALVRTLKDLGCQVAGLDILESPFTTRVVSISDRSWVRRCLQDGQQVFHAATLHNRHVATHAGRTSSTQPCPARSICWRKRRQPGLS